METYGSPEGTKSIFKRFSPHAKTILFIQSLSRYMPAVDGVHSNFHIEIKSVRSIFSFGFSNARGMDVGLLVDPPLKYLNNYYMHCCEDADESSWLLVILWFFL